MKSKLNAQKQKQAELDTNPSEKGLKNQKQTAQNARKGTQYRKKQTMAGKQDLGKKTNEKKDDKHLNLEK